MTLVPQDPFDLFQRIGSSLLPSIADRNWYPEWFKTQPRVDVHEDHENVYVTAEVPGLNKPDDVRITVRDRQLYLEGKIEQEAEHRDHHVHRTERYYGQFTRVVPLPAQVREEGAEATYHNGILKVRLPKAEPTDGQRIDVRFQ
ncbi:Hsp20/alpha crystallin family protein [Alicyclobacillus herbarius]|uniref:Hsp20/alpha crystallin family protein n=1 Tax=Alicyclobacillus herbarius TaxID=122960 RepID=UPI0004286FB8|nr:Hsp20/alpha crystallin family protein [Alicyclobacillus herbarius]